MLTMAPPAPEHDPSLRELVAKAQAARSRGGVLEAAKIRFINLPEVRDRAGAQWPRLRARLCDGSLMALRTLLADEDLVIPSADGFLAIFFANGDDLELARRAARIEEALTAYYAGEEGLELLQARVKRCVVDPAKLDEICAAAAVRCPEPPATTHIAAHPVWSLAAQTIACYFILPTTRADGVMRAGYDDRFREFGISTGADHLALDIRLLNVALQQAAALREIGAASIVGVSVHASTLRSDRARADYLRALAAVDPDLQRRFIVKIAEIENGARPLELAEWVALLRCHVRQVAFEFHAFHRAPNDLAKTKAWAAGFQMPQHVDVRGYALETPMRHWRSALTEAGMRFYIDNVRTRPELDAAAAHKVDFVISCRFWPPLHDLERRVR